MKKLLLLFITMGLLYAEPITNSIGMTFVKIPEGSLTLGIATEECPEDDPFTSVNELKVCLDGKNIQLNKTPQFTEKIESFYMATTEVTQLQYYKVMGSNPSAFKSDVVNEDSRHHPVEMVNLSEVKAFIKKLNEMEGTDSYYLPSEVEWEYAARAGSSKQWSFGDSEEELAKYAWYETNTTHPVAQKEPNQWGLYDMYGNVWEWTSSCYTAQYKQPCYKNYQTLLGGGYSDKATNTILRGFYKPHESGKGDGFRIAKKKKFLFYFSK
jgi:formylglycine-generating enzyme required for sulfatase activity